LLKQLARTDYTSESSEEGDPAEFHFRALATLFRKLSGSTKLKQVQRYGSHWEILGFQHTNPQSDLNRFGGVAHLLPLLYFMHGPTSFTQKSPGVAEESRKDFLKRNQERDQDARDLFQQIFTLSQDTDQNFPLVCTSVNFCKVCLEIAIADFDPGKEYASARKNFIKLVNQRAASSFCKGEDSSVETAVEKVRKERELKKAGGSKPTSLGSDGGNFFFPFLEAFCILHNSLLFQFYDEWNQKQLTIGSFGSVLAKLTNQAKKSPTQSVMIYEDYLRQLRDSRKNIGNGGASGAGGSGGGGKGNIVDLEQLQREAQARRAENVRKQDEQLAKYAMG
jgi:hypothetical protein